MKLLSVVFFIALTALSFSSCKKIQQDNLINGLWSFDEIYVDTSTTNFLTTFPHYNEGNKCCEYKVDFQRDDIVFAYYLTHDTFNYVVGGTWYLNQYNKLELHFDNYFDGKFDVHKTDSKEFELSSTKNHIKAYDGINPDLDTASMKIVMLRI